MTGMVSFDACCRKAGAWARQGRYADAEEAYREAIELRPEEIKVRLDLAMVLRRLRRSAHAEEVLREAVKLRPELASVHAELGAVLFEQSRYGARRTSCHAAAR